MISAPLIGNSIQAPCNAHVTVSVTLAECDLPPPVPLSTSVKVPRGVVFAVRTVSVELRPGATGFGESVAVAPLGSPATDSWTELEKPPSAPTVTEDVVCPPRFSVSAVGAAVTV